jgi:hypothetical protein
MRFYRPRRKPEPGETLTVRRFAWFPVQVGDFKIWLENYEEFRVFIRQEITVKLGDKPAKANIDKWMVISKRTIDRP